MAVPKSESSGRPHRKASTANRANQAPSKKGADAKSDEAADDAKKQAWEDAKKAAHSAQLAAAHRRVPIIRGEADDRPPAPKAANTAPVGQRNKAESKADGVAHKRANPLPAPPPPRLPPANTAPVGQRNKAESKADGVAHKRANPGPVAGLHNPITPYIDRVASTAKNPMTATGVTSPLDPFISGAANSPAMSPTATPTSAPRPAPSAPRPQTGGTPAGPGQVPFENGVDGRVADLWEIGQARLNGFAAEARQAAGGAAGWLWETGAGVARGVTSGEYKQAALQEYQARTREFADNPYQARKQANVDMLGGLGSAAWDAGQGVVWLGAQVVATGVEAVKLGGRISNGVSYLVSGEYVFDIDSKTAWQQANEMVSGYGGRWKQGIQTYSAEHWGMRTGQGGTEKSIFFSAGEVAGNVASVVAPPLAAASKAGVLARGTAAVASAEAKGALTVASSLADDAAAAASRTGAAAAGRGTSAVGALKTAGASVDDAAKAGQASGRGAPAILREAAVGGTPIDDAASLGVNLANKSATSAQAATAADLANRSVTAARTGAATVNLGDEGVRLARNAVGRADDAADRAQYTFTRGQTLPEIPQNGGMMQRLRDGIAKFNDRFEDAVQRSEQPKTTSKKSRAEAPPPTPAISPAVDEANTVTATLIRLGMPEIRVPVAHAVEGAGRGRISGAIREFRLYVTKFNMIEEAVQHARATAKSGVRSGSAHGVGAKLRQWTEALDNLTARIGTSRLDSRAKKVSAQHAKAEAKLAHAMANPNAKPADILKRQLEAREAKAAAQHAKAEAELARVAARPNARPVRLEQAKQQVKKREAEVQEVAAEAKWRWAEAARNGELGSPRRILASMRDTWEAFSQALFRDMPQTAKLVLQKKTARPGRMFDKGWSAVRNAGGKVAEDVTNFARRHPVVNELRLTSRELLRQGGRHHTLRDEIGRAVTLLVFNHPKFQAARKGVETIIDAVGAGIKLVNVVTKPVTKPAVVAVSKGLEYTGKTSWASVKVIPPYLAFEAGRGNVEFTNDSSALTRANLSTDPEHAMWVKAYTLRTTSDAVIPASLSIVRSGPTVKGYNPTTGAVEWDKVIPSTFARPGPDKRPQVASNRGGRASMGVLGVAWKIGPNLANFNGNAHVAFASLGATLRGEAGNIAPGQGFNIGGRAYASLAVLLRWSYESNFDYPPLNLPSGFFDGRLIFDATRPVLFNNYWFGGGHESVAEGLATLRLSPLGLSGVVKKAGGDLTGAYVGRTLVGTGGILWWGGTGKKDRAYYANTFGRNPEGKKAAEQLRAEHPGAYAREWPWGGRMFKQVEQFDPNDPTLPQILGAGGRDARTQADRVEEQLDRAERTPGPTAPWQGPVRQPRTQADRVEDRLRAAEQVRGPNPPARQIALEPPPVVNPGIAGQFVVSPRQGANVRSAPGIDAPEVSRFRHGEPLLQTGPAQVVEGERWVPVVGRDVGRRTVTGFVREDLIMSHPAGDKGPEGRVDSNLHRQGYRAIEVQPADTLRDICLRYGLSEDEIRDVIVLNRNHQIVDPDLIYPGDTVYLPHR